MNLKELKDLIALMNEHQLVEMEIEREGMKVRLRKGGAGPEGILVERLAASGAAVAAPLLPGPVPVPEAPARPSGVEVKSPMVGTFYRAPAPEAPPFVQVGQQIEVGQVLCILEAMKLMNEIKSEMRGTIAQILVENAQPVEFGQVLFLIEPN
ncbi:MAG: acetyl-CoA carboxylase biotin carboxyl carrier protein [Candidatus Omnitrophica bacterium]|nr:acetyl-CoA carboxylase biotin carboxyl carrier protein [Candidatus Omnitrophota bacterium]